MLKVIYLFIFEIESSKLIIWRHVLKLPLYYDIRVFFNDYVQFDCKNEGKLDDFP